MKKERRNKGRKEVSMEEKGSNLFGKISGGKGMRKVGERVKI